MDRYNNHLSIAENFFGTELTTHKQVLHCFNGLTESKYLDLVEAYIYYDQNWVTEECLGKDTLHIGRAYDSFNNPYSWLPRMKDSTPRMLDPLNIHRLLIYTPRLSVWVPNSYDRKYAGKWPITVGCDNYLMNNDLYNFICCLVGVRDFLYDGSVVIIPDRYYEDICQWNGSKKPSDMLQLAREEARIGKFRNIIDRVSFFTEEAEMLCSDSSYFHALSNREAICYINPLNEMNEDVAIQAIAGTSLVCPTDVMFDLLKVKYSDESAITTETTWEHVSSKLPRIHDLSIEDLASVRANEDAFAIWRDSLRNVVRSWDYELKNKGSISPEEALAIFNESTLPVRMNLENRIKAQSLRSKIESGGLSFSTGAVAAAIINPDPLLTMASGAITSSLQIIYEILKSQKLPTDQSLLRIFMQFGGREVG